MQDVHEARNGKASGHKIAWTHTSSRTSDRNSLVAPSGFSTETLATATANIVIIEKRALVRECITRGLRAASGYNVVSFPSVESWLDGADMVPASLILLCITGRPNDADTYREVSLLGQQSTRIPTIILSDVEDPDEIIGALDRGARGYIPTSLPLDIAIEAMRLVEAGGAFVPASSLVAARRSAENSCASKQTAGGLFTERQAAVVEALRRGKANKTIAYELDMRESTVKVHVRNIMKKLKARNRTEVAFMTNGLLASAGP